MYKPLFFGRITPEPISQQLQTFSFSSLFYIILIIASFVLPLVIPAALDVLWINNVPTVIHPSTRYNGEYICMFHSSTGTSRYSSSSIILNQLLDTSFLPIGVHSSLDPQYVSFNISIPSSSFVVQSYTCIFGLLTYVDHFFLKSSSILPLILSSDSSFSQSFHGGSLELKQVDSSIAERFPPTESLCELGLGFLCSKSPKFSSDDIFKFLTNLFHQRWNIFFDSTELKYHVPLMPNSPQNISSFFKIIPSTVLRAPTLIELLFNAGVKYFVLFSGFKFLFGFLFKTLIRRDILKVCNIKRL
ncbi:hypothetical protein GEMRC1_012493 [Eukaryota sp. GEM-RC1]